jgi:hypothetical protein
LSLGLGKYEAAFRENEIDETILPGLTAEDLKELGVAALGHRRKLLDAIAALGTRRGSECRVVALASAAARLMRAYSAQVETLRRLRHGGDQHVRVEHVHINEGAQAVIGSVRAPDRRHDATKEMPSQDQQIDSDC